MADFNTSKIDGNTVAALEWNQFADTDNIIITSGQTPSSSNLNQLGIAAARYSSGGQFFTDSGTANTYVLSPVSPFKSPVDATNTYFNGMTIVFRAGNANSGASTVNINGAGLKNLKKEDGSTDLTSGDILPTKDSRFRYNGTSFVLVQDIRPATTTNQGVAYLNNPITIANNATDANNDIDFSAGNAPRDDGSGQVLLASTLVKRLDASWSAGTNQGGLFSGTKANFTRYYLFAITNGTINDAGFDISPTGANIPAGYKGSYRGMVLTDGSGNIRPFTLAGQYIEYVGDITDYNPSPTSGVYATYALSCPSKNNILAKIMVAQAYTGSGVETLASSYRKTGSSANNLFFGGAVNGYTAHAATNFVPLNSSAQIDIKYDFTAPTSSFAIVTKGYFDFNIKL